MAWFTAHSLVILLAAAALVTGLWLFYQRARLRLHAGWILLLSPLHVIVGVACVKLFAAVETLSLDGFRKMSLFGAVFFLPLFYWLGAKLTKRKPADVFDVFTVPTVFTLACARVNCLLSGCCRGKPISGTAWRWPTREAELVFYVPLLLWLIWKTRRKDDPGILWPAYMAAYGLFRFLAEFFREPVYPLFHISHLWAALSFITGLSICLQIHSKSKTNPPKTKFHRRKSK